MTSTLLLKLRGPMQSWGHDSRYTVRGTENYPTKSGVLGLIAASQGRRRSDPIEDLAKLRFGVRIDQPGVVTKDFQTAIDWRTGKSMPLVTRYYLADAVFVAAIEGPDETIHGITEALERPRFPLYLGRRSCPANIDLVIGVQKAELEQALRHEAWHASTDHRRTRPKSVELPIYRDVLIGESGRSVRDLPVSFAHERREYAWRDVVQDLALPLDNPLGRGTADPFFETVVSA